MGAKNKEINPIRGKRLKQLIEEQKITQVKLSKDIHISQQAISEMIHGKATVTETTALAVSEKYPEYTFEWIMGFDEFKNPNERNLSVINTARKEGELLANGFVSFAKLSGYEIECGYFGNEKIDPIIKRLRHQVKISKNGKSAYLSYEEFNELENELCDYVEMRLKRIVNRKGRVNNG